MSKGAIGVFDSGYGGLTILDAIRRLMPQYDYVYFGDNARAPYGTRSFDVVYQYTLEAVQHLFDKGCPLVILGCNTASAKALRTIQQHYLPEHAPTNRVLGVIRPTAEVVGTITRNGHIGVLATEGTIKSESYNMEILKLFPDCKVTGLACPMWVGSAAENRHQQRIAGSILSPQRPQQMDAEVAAGKAVSPYCREPDAGKQLPYRFLHGCVPPLCP